MILLTNELKYLVRQVWEDYRTEKRYSELLDSGKYGITDITVMTFRKSAAEDVREAIAKSNPFLEIAELESHVGTIHSICYS